MTSSLQRPMFPSQLYGDVRATLDSNVETTLKRRLCVYWEACNFVKKEALTQVFSCEICEIYKKPFLYATPPVAASEHSETTEYVKN